MKRGASGDTDRSVQTWQSHQAKEVAKPPVEAMLFLLPGVSSIHADCFRRWATEAGLVHYVRGEGKTALNINDFGKPIPGGLKRNAHVFIHGHGNDDSEEHRILLDKKNNTNGTSSKIMARIQSIPSAVIDADSSTEQAYTLHWVTCFSGLLRKELTPDNPLWTRGAFFLYSGKKSTMQGDVEPLIEGSLDYLGKCKQQQTTPDPLVLFETLAHRRSDCISVGGGTLRAMVIAHTPRGLSHITGAIFATHPDNVEKNKIQGDPTDIQRLAHIEAERQTRLQVKEIPDNEHIARLLFKCIDHDHLAAFESLLLAHPELITCLDSDGESPLMTAAQLGSEEIARSLINRLDNLDDQNADGRTALHFAINAKHDEETQIAMITLLLSGNVRSIRANINAQDHQGNTPLHKALQSDSSKAALLLFDWGADIDARNKDGITPFTLAKNRGYKRLFSLMLSQRTVQNDDEGSISNAAWDAAT